VHYFFAIALNQVPDTFKVLYYIVVSGKKFKGREKKVPSHHHDPRKEKERNDGRVGADI
jgi:hypothetical protein